jgi:hypothetical protein
MALELFCLGVIILTIAFALVAYLSWRALRQNGDD